MLTFVLVLVNFVVKLDANNNLVQLLVKETAF
jgi:hypothetical protein